MHLIADFDIGLGHGNPDLFSSLVKVQVRVATGIKCFQDLTGNNAARGALFAGGRSGGGSGRSFCCRFSAGSLLVILTAGRDKQ